jgi:hypothetical protein
MPKIKDLKDRLVGLPDIHSVADFEEARKKNLKDGFWACACGCRKFHLMQDTHNVKAICVKCGHLDIIYWNSMTSVSDSGKGKRLDTTKWVTLKAVLSCSFK